MKYRLINYYPPYEKKDIGKIVWFGPNNLLDPENYPEFWQPVKDYEILSLARFCSIKPTITDVSDHNNEYIEALLKCDKARIHSVKRLSDGEIFTIGDFVNGRTISSFSINWMEIGFKIHCDDVGKGNINDGCFFELQDLQKAKTPLFTTEDGVDIFEGDDFYYVKFIQYNMTMGKPFEIVKGNHPTFKYEPQFEKYFSTKETAEEYILMNKPCLSLNDIFKDVEEMRKGLKTFENSQLAKRFKKLVKQKLKSC